MKGVVAIIGVALCLHFQPCWFVLRDFNLIFSIIFITSYGILHGLFVNLIWDYSVVGAFAGVYIILILDFYCAVFGILACVLDDGTKAVLIPIFVVLGINCVVNAFVGMFISTGIKKFTEATPKLRKSSPIKDCTETSINDSCKDLSFIQMSMYVMYIQLLVRLCVVFAARKAFFIEPGEPQRRRYGTFWREYFAKERAEAQQEPLVQPA